MKLPQKQEYVAQQNAYIDSVQLFQTSFRGQIVHGPCCTQLPGVSLNQGNNLEKS